jgi:acyl-CoA thioesterase I
MKIQLILCALLCCLGTANAQKSYLALGDSYTKGERVSKNESFPYQLRKSLSIDDIDVIAETGWTSSDLIEAYKKKSLDDKYDIVTILIGVNNFYQNQPFTVYEQDLVNIFKFARSKVDSASQVWVISIPDYGYTPFGSVRNPDKIAVRTDTYNVYNQRLAKEFGFKYVNVTRISRDTNPKLVAEDGLHPSAYQYSLWVDKMLMKP